MTITNIPNWQTLTPAEIVAYCAARHETAHSIPAQEARNWLRENGLARPSLAGGWTGKLISLATADGTDPKLRDAIEDLLAHLSSPGAVQVETDRPEIAAIIPLLIAVAGLDADGVASLYAMGSGRKWPLLDGASADAAKQAAIDTLTAETLQQRKVDWQTRFDAAMNQVGTVEQDDGLAAMRLLVDEMEASL